MANKIYWALQTTYPHGFSTDYATILSNLNGPKPSLIHIGTLQMSSGNTFSTSGLQTLANDATAQGAYPTMDLFSTLSTNLTTATTWNNPSFTAGSHDTYLHSLSASFVAYGKPILVYFDSEMNGNWYPAIDDIRTDAGNSAGSFKLMWQYVHNLFVADGATNVSWALVYNIQSPDGSGAATAETTQPMSQFWPGSSFVDVMGLDGMNFAGGMSGTGGPASGFNWYLIDQVMDGATGSAYGNSWTHLTALDPNIPCTFGSFSCASSKGKDQNASWATAPILDGSNKGAWYSDLAAALTAKYSRVAAYRYYNIDHTGSNGEPYANGYSLHDNDGAFMSPYATATTPLAYTSPDTGNNLTATVVNAGAQQANFRAMVGGSNHLQGGAFTLLTSGKMQIPFAVDAYEATEEAITPLSLELRLDDTTKTNGSTAIDSSGNGLNGTYSGTTAATGTTLPGSPSSGSFQTDGTDYVSVPDAAALSPQVGGKIWLSFWYQLAALPAATATFVAKGGQAANQWEYSIDLSSTQQWRWFLLTNTGSVAIGATATLSPSLNTWHRVDCAFDSTLPDGTTDKAVMYHDGVRLAGGSTIGANVLTNGTSALYVARRGDGTNPLGTVANPAVVKDIRLRPIYPTAVQVLTEYYAGLAITSQSLVLAAD